MSSSWTTGIAVLAIVETILGIVALFGGIVHLTLGIGGLMDFSGRDLTLSNRTAAALDDAFTIESVILLVASYAVWSGKKWGWNLTVSISLIGLLTSIGALAIQAVLSIIGLIANVGILIYVMRPPVKAYFGKGGSATPEPA